METTRNQDNENVHHDDTTSSFPNESSNSNNANNMSNSNENEVVGVSNNIVAPVMTTHSVGENFANEERNSSQTGVHCSFLPHGIYAVFPALFSTFAWLSSLSQDGCDYARLEGPIVADITDDPEVPFLDVGFNQYRAPTKSVLNEEEWVVDYRLPCEDYNPDVVEMDGYWKFSKGTAFLSLVFGGGGALFLWFSSCFVFTRGTWHWAGYELLAATIFQALSFLWFKTSLCHGHDGQDSCSLYYGSQADILACSFWFISVVAVFCKYPKARMKVIEATATNPSDLEMTRQSTTSQDLSRPATAGTGDGHEII